MSNPQSAEDPRNKAEAILQVKYSVRLHQLHRRLYRRVTGCGAFISLLAGSAALISAMQMIPGALLAAAIVVAAISAMELAFGWTTKAARHDVSQRDFNRLLGRAAGLDLDQLDAEIVGIECDEPDAIDWLRSVAWNDVLRTAGHLDGVHPENTGQRLMRALA